MPQDFEGEFRKVAQDLAKKNRQVLLQRIGIFSILLGMAFYWISWLLKANPFVVGAGTTSLSFLLLLGVSGAVVFLGCRNSFLKSRPEFQNSPRLNFLRLSPIGRVLHHLRSTKRRYILGYSLLLVALIHRQNPSLFTIPVNNFVTELRYHPSPPSLTSPWPWKNQEKFHPLISSLPPSAETSIRSVATYISQREPDPYLQVKALHDYVIARVTYDNDVLEKSVRPLQDAKTVFATRKGVCEGYAKLFAALGQEIGLDVVTITGKVRDDLAPVDVIPLAMRAINSDSNWTLHAWNAVKIKGHWQIVDTTWDDRNNDQKTPIYSAEYLMPPPEAMILSHLPDLSAWQLTKHPISESTFEEQPLLTPQFFKEKLQLQSPRAYKTKVANKAVINIKHPSEYQKDIFAVFNPKEKHSLLSLLATSKNGLLSKPQVKPCQSSPTREDVSQVSCHLPTPGDYQVLLFSAWHETSSPKPTISALGQLSFHSH
jgi:transglutaminase-like putative cysteine protease